jgi:hypothetical protein
VSHLQGINGQEGFQGAQGQIFHPLHVAGENDPPVQENFPHPGFELGQDPGQGLRLEACRFPGLAAQHPEGQEKRRQAQDRHYPIDDMKMTQAGRVPGG